MEIAIASGKGGTGKTLFATNLAWVMETKIKTTVTLLDCDVEEPNSHIFYPNQTIKKEKISIKAPIKVDKQRCTGCGKCVNACNFNALALVKNNVLIFNELCHACGACLYVCPKEAVLEGSREIGELIFSRGKIDLVYATLTCGEGGMTPRLIKKVREEKKPGVNILDAPPGTACPAVEAVKKTDLCILVADPTPFGLHDLKLAVNMCRTLGEEPVVIINRSMGKEQELKKYCQESSLEIIGEIPDDQNIAKIYSRGELLVKKNPYYFDLFWEIAKKIIKIADSPRPPKKPKEERFFSIKTQIKGGGKEDNSPKPRRINPVELPELVIISGKGGTGKTSLVGAFATLGGNSLVADCDVDASDLPLLLQPAVENWGVFSGGQVATIKQEQCKNCGVCKNYCRFEAISHRNGEYFIDPLSCEGCGLCYLVCPNQAIEINKTINGEWYVSRTRTGKMAHSRLGLAQENSGRLVTLTREKAGNLFEPGKNREVLIDGSPGTGCPVIASLSGANYALIVTEPTLSGIHDLKRIVELTNFFRIPAGVVVNKWDINQGISGKIEKYSLEQGLDFLGKLPFDHSITLAQFDQKTIIEYAPLSPLSIEIKKLWGRLLSRLRKTY